jgi:hypothetical protein
MDEGLYDYENNFRRANGEPKDLFSQYQTQLLWICVGKYKKNRANRIQKIPLEQLGSK